MTAWESIANELFSGVMGMGDISVWMMFLIGGLLIYLGVQKDYEPMLLFPMGVGCILANIPGHFAVIPTGGGEPGFLSVLYEAGIANELFPVLIFIAVGAMCEFDPLIRAPYVMLFAAAGDGFLLHVPGAHYPAAHCKAFDHEEGAHDPHALQGGEACFLDSPFPVPPDGGSYCRHSGAHFRAPHRRPHVWQPAQGVGGDGFPVQCGAE